MPSCNWLELEIERLGNEVAVEGRGCREEQPEQHTLGPDLSADLDAFAERVRAAAASGRPLGPDLERARALYQALFRGELQTVLARLCEDARGGPVLLRLLMREKDLQAFPWEALCEPGTDFGFLGNSASLMPVRGVHSREPRQPREVRGAVRVLVIAPLHEDAVARLKGALHESLASGELEWLEPLCGPRARKAALLERLRRPPVPHIIHFIGHGGLEDGRPVLRLADEDDEESWIPVELLAQQLGQAFGSSSLRLVVLEACEGASPGNQACAAELLARTGADAVVAHLWPVRTDVARKCSGAFYRALTRSAQQQGDVALSLNEARRSVLAELGGSAEAFSPVLYLRGCDPVLFDFRGRRVSPPQPAIARTGAVAPSRALERLLDQPFTLVLGDRWEEEDPVLHSLQERLRKELAEKMGAEPPELPLPTLAQHFALHIGEEELALQFQEIFGEAVDFMPPLAGALARRLGPGVHITLLRLPVLEQALALQRPELSLYVVQPSWQAGGRIPVFRREAGAGRWERLHEVPDWLDPEREVVVLRLCSGYLPPHLFTRPLLTEDDYLQGARGLENLLPAELADSLQGTLSLRPALLLELSVLSWNHRMLLHQLFGRRPLPRSSVAVLPPGTGERELWGSGKGLPGEAGVQVLEADDDELLRQLETLGSREAA